MENQDFHLHFVNQNRAFDISFLEQQSASNETVLINGRHYSLEGSSVDVQWLKEKIPELSTTDSLSLQNFKEHLQFVGSQDITQSSLEKVREMGIHSLQPEQQVGRWMAKDRVDLQKTRDLVASKYWESRILSSTKANHSPLIEFLKGVSDRPSSVEEGFYKALLHRDVKQFRSLFQNLSFDQVGSIDSGEKLDAIEKETFSQDPVIITSSDCEDMQQFLQDSQISGVLMLCDSKEALYTLISHDLEDANTAFAIHSIGKVFTGLLVLRFIEEKIIAEEELNKTIQLDPIVTEQLPKNIRKQLQKTTLLEVMLHQGRYGDYLGNYEDAIEQALRMPKAVIPQIEEPEDFLQYADPKLIDLDQLGPSGESYSNLGLLLVGLSLKHLYHVKTGKNMKYQDILKKFILQPAKIEIFEIHKPEKARVNPDDPVAPYIAGGPAGGYWSTATDLLKAAEWIRKKCTDPQFMHLLEQYGGEFYSNAEVSHGGSLLSSSAHLSHRIANQLSMVMMTSTKGLGKATHFCREVQRHLLMKKK